MSTVQKKTSLGRGLGELLGEIEEAYDNELPKNETIIEVPLTQIKPNPYQPRKHFDEKALQELANSIKTHGLIQPIVLVEDIDGYILVAGERRWRASKLAKLKTIRAVIADIDHDKMRAHALIENIQREELNIIELSQAYDELIKVHGLTHESLSVMVSKSRSHITNTLRLLILNKKAKTALIEEKITAGHAKVLVTLDERTQVKIVDSIIGQKLSVRDTESLVQSLKKPLSASIKKEQKSNMDGLDTLKQHMQKLGFKAKGSGCSLSLSFDSSAQIEELLKLLDK